MRRDAEFRDAISRDVVMRNYLILKLFQSSWQARITASRRIVSRMIASHVLALVLASACGSAGAQVYPAKPVRLLVSFSAGSGTDTIARIVAGGLSQPLGQQVVVENRAGAAGNIGAELAAKSPPDGYTLFLVNMGHAANVTLYEKKLAYDLVRDFAPVTQLASSPSIVVVHPSLPVKSIGELVRLAKARPGAITTARAVSARRRSWPGSCSKARPA